MVHRILTHYLDTQGPLLEDHALHELGNDTSFTERRAAEAERELIEWKKVKFMEDRVGDEFDALIISTTKFGFFVELTELFVEGLVPDRDAARRSLLAITKTGGRSLASAAAKSTPLVTVCAYASIGPTPSNASCSLR